LHGAESSLARFHLPPLSNGPTIFFLFSFSPFLYESGPPPFVIFSPFVVVLAPREQDSHCVPLVPFSISGLHTWFLSSFCAFFLCEERNLFRFFSMRASGAYINCCFFFLLHLSSTWQSELSGESNILVPCFPFPLPSQT